MLKGTSETPSHLPEIISFEGVQDARSYECLVTGKFDPAAFLGLLTLLESSGVIVQTSSFEARAQEDTFSATILIQMSKSDVDMFLLVDKVMRSRLVDTIEFSPRNKRIFSNFRFPVDIVRNERAVLVRADTIFDWEIDFRKILGEKSDILFFNAGRSFGEDLVRLCPRTSEFENDTEYLEAVLDGTQATGWGVTNCQQLEGAELQFSLSEPPSVDPTKIPSNFMIGMILGIAQAVFHRKMQVVAASFEKSKRLFFLRMAQVPEDLPS